MVKCGRLGMVADQLKILMKEYNVTQRKIAEIAGVSPPAVKKWFDGDTKNIATKYSIKIAKYFNVSIEWLTNGVGSRYVTEPERIESYDNTFHHMISLPLHKSYLSKIIMGNNTPETIALDSSLLELINPTPERAELLKIEHNNMTPLLFKGEYAVIDRDQTKIEDGKIYAYYLFEQIRINRLYKKIDGSIVLKNENPSFDDDIISLDKIDYAKILGRVVARFGATAFS